MRIIPEMKLQRVCIVLSAIAALAVLPAYAQDRKTTPERTSKVKADKGEVTTREKAELVTVTGAVEAVDVEKRLLTLKGPLGNIVTFKVDERVKRLNEVGVGDAITADFYISLAAEIREPTPEEKESPLIVIEGGGKAPSDVPPAAGAVRVIKAVVTVEGLFRPTQMLTVKGPLGNYVTIPVEDLEQLEKLRLGDTIVVTYTEALAISLEKVKKETKERQE